MNHTAAPKGKRVKVILRDGTSFVDKFVERTQKYLVFQGRRVSRATVRGFSIYRQKDGS